MKIKKDKAWHFLVGAAISFVFSFAHPVLGVVISLLAGSLKEIYDKRHPLTHTSEFADVIATFAGGIFGLVIYLLGRHYWSIF